MKTVFALVVVIGLIAFCVHLSNEGRESSPTPVPSQPQPSITERVAERVEKDRAEDMISKAAYVQESVKILEFKAAYFEDYNGRIAGVKFRIQNAGNRTINRLDVIVRFRDDAGRIIGEQELSPISQFTKPLCPGCIWQIDQGGFYPAKNIPSEWHEGWAFIQTTYIDLGPLRQ